MSYKGTTNDLKGLIMLYNSYIFVLFFLPASLIGYFTLNKFGKYQSAKGYLILMSFWFYGYFNPSYLPIIISSILLNFALGKLMLKDNKKPLQVFYLLIGLAFNVGILFYFKYFDFFISNINFAFKRDFNLKNLVLPLGISFFTFQQLSYVIDCYKKIAPPCNILDYSLFVTFFPQLVAGPIVLYSEVIPQFENLNNKKIDYENMSKGIVAFAFGLAKKVLIADLFGRMVNVGFGNIPALNTTNAVIVMLAYTFQIYFDFSGYCDMATGIGYMFNIKIVMNFNSPYKALTITEFWERWHITLTRFFTTYVYIPLGGNRKGKARTYLNIFIVFLVSGLWHGANWTFIVWGLLHGLASVLTRFYEDRFKKLNPVFSWLVTFTFLNLTWVIFRAESLALAKKFFRILVSLNFGSIDKEILNKIMVPEIKFLNEFITKPLFINVCFISFFVFALMAVLQMKNVNERINEFKPTTTILAVSVILTVWSIMSFAGVSTFLYFNF